MVVSIAGRQMYMWRAVDSEGEVLEILVLGRELRAPRRKPVRRVLDRIEAASPRCHMKKFLVLYLAPASVL
jgi:transposase-like protein